MKILLLSFASLLLASAAAFSQTPHSVTLNWTWTQGTGDPADGYHVKRSSVAGGPYTTLPTGTIPNPATFTFIDTTVTAGLTYFYVVTAFNLGGDSVPSNQVTCTIPFQAPTTAPSLSAVTK